MGPELPSQEFTPEISIGEKIMACNSLEELYQLFRNSEEYQESYKEQFLEQRNKIEFNSKFKSNGKLSVES